MCNWYDPSYSLLSFRMPGFFCISVVKLVAEVEIVMMQIVTYVVQLVRRLNI